MGKASKTIIYVDGFNLYYGALKKPNFKWLDLEKLCSLILPQNEIVKIKYFTALVSQTEENPSAPVCQLTYLRALKTLPKVEIHYGHYLTQHKPRRLSKFPDLPVRVIIPEEKGSDVNLASHLLHDAHKNRFETAVVISNDSDLVAPIRFIREDLGVGKEVGIFNPQENDSVQLKKFASFYRPLRQGPISGAQFPVEMSDQDGTFRKPEEWESPREKVPPKRLPLILPINVEDQEYLKKWVSKKGYNSRKEWLQAVVQEAINEEKATLTAVNPSTSLPQ